MNIVHLCDCMDFMRGLPDKAYDLAIVDPPYGLNMAEELHNRGKTCKKNNYKEYPLKKWDCKKPDKPYFDELFRISKKVIIWGFNNFVENLTSTQGVIVWDKCNDGFSFADGELAWSNFNKALRIYRHTRGYTGRIHPTQKPVALYKWLLKNYAKPGQTIFDSHVGSGSIRIACHDMGFDFEGCELDADYWTAQEKRYRDHVAQGEIFDKKEIQENIFNKDLFDNLQ